MRKYADCYPSKAWNCIFYFLRFFVGTFMLFIFIISVIEEKALIDLQYKDFNLLWYFAILTIITAVLNNLLKSKDFEESNTAIVKKLTKYLYVLPPADLVNNYRLYKEYTQHYKTNIELILLEIFSIIISPYIIYICYYKNTVHIIDFIQKNTIEIEHVGYIDI